MVTVTLPYRSPRCGDPGFSRPALRPHPLLGGRPLGTAAAWNDRGQWNSGKGWFYILENLDQPENWKTWKFWKTRKNGENRKFGAIFACLFWGNGGVWIGMVYVKMFRDEHLARPVILMFAKWPGSLHMVQLWTYGFVWYISSKWHLNCMICIHKLQTTPNPFPKRPQGSSPCRAKGNLVPRVTFLEFVP